MIALQLLFQSTQHLALVLLVFHVDEVDDDDAADVAQAQLPGDRGGGLEVGLEDGLFKVAMADEGAGVHIDRGHRFSRVDHQVATGLQRHLALQCTLDLVLDAIQVENRPFARVVLEAVGDFRHQFANELRSLLEGFPRVDADLLDLRVDQVTQGTQGQAQVLVDDRGRTAGLDLGADLLPQAAQVADVLQDLSARAPSAAVRRMKPPASLMFSLSMQSLTTCLRRSRSASSSIFREMPTWLLRGMYTR